LMDGCKGKPHESTEGAYPRFFCVVVRKAPGSQWMLHWWRVNGSTARELFPYTHPSMSCTVPLYPSASGVRGWTESTFSCLECEPAGNRSELHQLDLNQLHTLILCICAITKSSQTVWLVFIDFKVHSSWF